MAAARGVFRPSARRSRDPRRGQRDYYTRLERGNELGSPTPCSSRFCGLWSWTRPSGAPVRPRRAAAQMSPQRRRRRTQQRIRPDRPAHARRDVRGAGFVRNGRLDILGANRLFRALYSGHFDGATRGEHSSVRLPRSRCPDFYVDWDRVANDVVAVLRAEAGRDPYDRELSDLVGELSTRSELFRRSGPPTTCTTTTRAQAFPAPASRRAEPDLRGDASSWPIPA